MKTKGKAIVGGILAMAGRKSPWSNDANGGQNAEGPASGGDSSPGEKPEADPPVSGPRNPWLPGGEPPPRRSASLEDLFRPGKKGPGGGGNGGGFGGGGFPGLPSRADGKSWMPWLVGGAIALWFGATSYHQLGSTQQGIVTTFGKYSRTVGPGASLTLPWPIQSVEVEAVTQTQRDRIPDGEEEKLMLTSDQNLIDLSYQVRWNIKDLKLYKFRLSDPKDTVKEVAEAAMRASVAEVTLNGVMGGTGRADVEQKVRQRMQAVLDAYKSGVRVLGVEIKKSDPPDKVNAAFQQVSVAQQDAQRAKSNAQAYAQQLTAQAQGAAAEFDKVYEQYKLAPGVTRRRIYYETMERVLSNNEKVIVEANGVTPYLPLPQIRQKPQEPTITVQGAQ
jgi:modulator of FtsH protease HflK